MEPDDPDPTRRFSDRADDYARFRPSYPAAAIDAILLGLRPPAELVAADVGAGTGIATQLLAERGVRVVAVEPNAAMRAAAAPHPRIEWRDGVADATGLADGSADLVVVAQAFHWFDVARTTREFQRILRADGRLAIMWNRRSVDDAFTLGYRRAFEATGTEAPVDRSHFDPAVVTSTGRFTDLRVHALRNAQALTRDEMFGRMRSTSTVPKSGPRHDALVERLGALHAAHADATGRATMVYRTDVFTWTRVASA